MVVDYLRAVARGAASGKTVTFYLGGAGRPGFYTWSATPSEAPGQGHARHALKTLQGGLCRQKHSHRNTDSKIGPGGQETRPETQGKRPKTQKTDRN